MKIRTKNELQDFLNQEMSWRRQELAFLLSNVKNSKDQRLSAPLRSAIVLLYAHFEGFVKKASIAYLTYVSNQDLSLSNLSNNFVALALKKKMTDFERSKGFAYCQLVDYIRDSLHEKLKISPEFYIDTKANLNSNLLVDIATIIDIDYSEIELKANIVDAKLLKYRNAIAHGDQTNIEKADYLLIHDEIVTILDIIKNCIENNVQQESFKKLA